MRELPISSNLNLPVIRYGMLHTHLLPFLIGGSLIFFACFVLAGPWFPLFAGPLIGGLYFILRTVARRPRRWLRHTLGALTLSRSFRQRVPADHHKSGAASRGRWLHN